MTHEEPREAASPVARLLLLGVGHVAVALGVLGIFLPLLPTTPFMLLAAACYARASRRFYQRLVAHPVAGPIILEWRRNRSIPRRAKRLALIAIALTFGLTIALALESPVSRLALGALGLGLAGFIWRLPSGPPTGTEGRGRRR